MYTNGFLAFVANQSYYIKTMDSMQVTTGFVSNMILERKIIKRLPKPYSDCLSDEDINRSDSPIIKRMKEVKVEYDQTTCLEFYIHKRQGELCNCSVLKEWYKHGLGDCFQGGYSVCTRNAYNKYIIDEMKNLTSF